MIIDERQPRPVDDEPTEESPLLAEQEDAAAPPTKASRFVRFQRAHLALPVVFFGFFAGTITLTTSVEILQIISCQFWWSRHDPSRIPPDGNIPNELCGVPGVQKLFSQLFQVFIILDLCGGLITSSPVGTLAAKFGRKPLLITVATITTFSALILILALRNASLPLIFVASAFSAIAGPRQLLLLSTMFVVDLAPNPAPVLSILEGSIYLGLSISYALGGVITTRSGRLTTVFWVQATISAAILLYVIVAIPETFGRDKRAARAAEVAAERVRRPSLASRSSSLERIRDTTSAFARPFGLIWPRRDPTTGKRNKRLLLLSTAMFFALIGTTYVAPAWMLFVTNHFHATPEQNGYVLSLLSSIKTIYLLFVLPVILKWGRSFYNQRWRSSDVETDADLASSHFDVYLLAVSWFVDAIATSGIGLSRSMGVATAWVMLFSLGSGASPCISTIVSASVEPLARGEALAAIALVRSVSEFLSPIILGSIMNATIDTSMPQAMFFVSSILMAFGVGISTFIRDSDRYIPHEERLRRDDNLCSGDLGFGQDYQGRDDGVGED
ncbi:hypothetical protein FRC08_015172 [Ceratobasidium sp. 394]|nr:hypothetical protein FRC08_015172 [Ceratobasidium sp. 394]